jgi:RND family efflux transporter MFP subunit
MRPRAVILVALAVAALGACREEQKAQAPQPQRPVLVETVTFAPRMQERSFVATIRPRIENDLAFRVGGRVGRRLVDVGAPVVAGQVLAELDPTDLSLQREQAQAEEAAATAALAQAQADLDRITTLRGEGWSTPANLDRQRALVQEATSRLTRARRAAELAGNALGYATLTAPAAGVVTAVSAEAGQVVAQGQPILRLARSDEPEASVAIPEGLVERVREGQATLALWSAPDRTFAATLRELAPAADPASRTYAARFSLEPAARAQVRLGQSGTLTLADPPAARVARLPLSALFNQGGGPAAWVVDPSTGALSLRPVEVAAYEARSVLVSGGLREGELVVSAGVHKLDAGQTVRVARALTF